MVEVAAAIIYKEGKILICQRKAGGSCGNLWEFPGGKRESGESMAQCLARECLEELKIKITVGNIFANTVYEYPEITVSITFFEAKVLEGIPQPTVHLEICWVKASELSAYDFCPADREVISSIQNSFQ